MAMFTLEEVPGDAPPEVIQLSGPCRAPADQASVRFVHAPADNAAMSIVVGDARSAENVASMIASRPQGMVAIAVVTAGEHLPQLVARYDAVLPIAPRAGDVLQEGVDAITAFATANIVSMPVDEAYPFFVDAGEIRRGFGEGPDMNTALNAALTMSAPQYGGRVLLHLETRADDLRADLSVVKRLLAGAFDIFLSVSERDDGLRRASVLTSDAKLR